MLTISAKIGRLFLVFNKRHQQVYTQEEDPGIWVFPKIGVGPPNHPI